MLRAKTSPSRVGRQSKTSPCHCYPPYFAMAHKASTKALGPWPTRVPSPTTKNTFPTNYSLREIEVRSRSIKEVKCNSFWLILISSKNNGQPNEYSSTK